MSSTPQVVGEPSDAELIASVRGGDLAGYGLLYERHVEAARRLARQLSPGPDADDLVADAFSKVLGAIQRGGGPDVSFRAYLLTAVRSLKVDGVRASNRVQPTDEIDSFDPGVPFRDTAVEGFENAAAAAAFSSLPERWQLVLWHTEVEGQKPAEIAPLLGMSANSVAALAYRAREGLRQAFLTQHASEVEGENCRWAHQNMGAYVRKATSNRDTIRMQNHIQECVRCAGVYAELSQVNSNLAGIIAPLLLGGLAAGYLSTAAGAAASGGVLAMLFGRVRDTATANGPATVAVGVATVAAAAVAVAAASGVLPGLERGEPASDVPVAQAPAVPGQSPAGPAGSAPSQAAQASPSSAPSQAAVTDPPPVGPAEAPSPLLAPRAIAPGPVLPSAPATPPTSTPSAPVPDLTPTEPAAPTRPTRPTRPSVRPEPTPGPSLIPTPKPTPPPSPSPSPAPTNPTPEPTPTPTPTPDPTPGPTPTPDPGHGPSADLAVHATSEPDGLFGHQVTVTVSGLASGAEAELRLSVDRMFSSLSSNDSQCTVSGSTAVCRLLGVGSDLKVVFGVTTLLDATVTVQVSDGGDPDPSNNTTHLRLDR